MVVGVKLWYLGSSYGSLGQVMVVGVKDAFSHKVTYYFTRRVHTTYY